MSNLLRLEKVTKIYHTSERAFLPGLGAFFEQAQDLNNLREALSFKKLLSAYRDLRGAMRQKRQEFLMRAGIHDRAQFLRGIIYKENEFAVTAVLDVSLTVENGEFAAIAGPSGSGKSTLLNLIATLEAPSYGRIYFQDQEINGLSEDERADFRLRHLGFVFQAFNLIPVLSAFENVEYALILKGLPFQARRERVRQALAYVGLSDCAHRRPARLSGGQQQRVAIARALAAQPRLILADEPTANLDSKTATSILDLMERINKEQLTTFIFSSHDPLVLSRARRVIHLRDGEIIRQENRQTATPSNLESQANVSDVGARL